MTNKPDPVSAKPIYVVECRYIWNDGTPATDWEPWHQSMKPVQQELVAKNPHRDGLGKSLPGGRAAYRYELREVPYVPESRPTSSSITLTEEQMRKVAFEINVFTNLRTKSGESWTFDELLAILQKGEKL